MSRLAALIVLIAACSSPARPPPAPPIPTTAPVVVERVPPSCGEAAAGIEKGTRDIRDPEASVLSVMHARCREDRWSAKAIECFAQLGQEDLAACSLELAPEQREKMFTALGGSGGGRVTIAIAIARLSTLKVGIVECDQFVTTVAGVLSCEAMPVDARAELGAETADFWSLPTAKLDAGAQARMAAVCGQSLAALQKQATDAGCMP